MKCQECKKRKATVHKWEPDTTIYYKRICLCKQCFNKKEKEYKITWYRLFPDLPFPYHLFKNPKITAKSIGRIIKPLPEIKKRRRK